jgi:hypothetical protein
MKEKNKCNVPNNESKFLFQLFYSAIGRVAYIFRISKYFILSRKNCDIDIYINNSFKILNTRKYGKYRFYFEGLQKIFISRHYPFKYFVLLSVTHKMSHSWINILAGWFQSDPRRS